MTTPPVRLELTTLGFIAATIHRQVEVGTSVNIASDYCHDCLLTTIEQGDTIQLLKNPSFRIYELHNIRVEQNLQRIYMKVNR